MVVIICHYTIPDIAYYGESWYFDNAQLGHTFVEHSEHVLSVVTEFNPETRFLLIGAVLVFCFTKKFFR